MAKYLVEDTSLTAIADAIREKTGGEDKLTLDAMAENIAAMETGGGNDVFLSVLEGTATELVLPDGLVNLKTIMNASANLTSVTFPKTLETICRGAFAYLQVLTCELVFPYRLKSIGSSAFNTAYQIPSITFIGTPETVAADAFANCSGVKNIYVPWAEGAVANAPWGATNATIHYESMPTQAEV